MELHTLSLAIDVTNAPWTDELPVNKHVRANSAPRRWPLAAPKRPRPLRCCDLSAIISSLHSASGRPLLASNAPVVFQSMLCCFSSHFQNVHRRQPSGRPLLNTLSTAQSFHNHARHTIFITDYWPGSQRLCGTSRWHQVRGERESWGGEGDSGGVCQCADELIYCWVFGLLSQWPAGGN